MQQFGAYGMIAALCAALNILVVVLFDSAGANLMVSVTMAFAACVVFGFFLHSRFTFRQPASWRRLVRYSMAMLANFPLSVFAIWLFRDVVGLSMLAAATLSTFLLTVYNFMSSRWAIGEGPPS